MTSEIITPPSIITVQCGTKALKGFVGIPSKTSSFYGISSSPATLPAKQKK
jgi:hypothetical protein